MSDLKATHPVSLQFLMNEEIYLIDSVMPVQHSSTETKIEKAPEQPIENIAFDYLGENNKYFLLLVNYPDHKIMAPKELEALQSILGAKKMELKDVAIVNLHKYPQANFKLLKDFFACNKIVFFGINPQQIQLPGITSNQITEHDSVKLLGTFSFTEMMDNVDKKKLFWNTMKAF